MCWCLQGGLAWTSNFDRVIGLEDEFDKAMQQGSNPTGQVRYVLRLSTMTTSKLYKVILCLMWCAHYQWFHPCCSH